MQYTNYALAALMVGTIGWANLPDRDWQFEHMRDVSVKVERATGGSGSGVLIAPDLILTNAHVAGSAKEFTIIDRETIRTPGTPVWVSQEHDVALIRLSSPLPYEPATFNCARPEVGEEIAAVGYPIILKGIFSFGRVASNEDLDIPTRFMDQVKMILGNTRVDIRIGPGSSGSPVFNKDGEVIGLMNAVWLAPISFGAVTYTGLSDMVPAAQFCDYLPH